MSTITSGPPKPAQELKSNLFTPASPIEAEVIENRRLTPPERGETNDVRHIVMRFSEPFPYVAGQSVGVVIPGVDPQTGKPHKLRLYSIASCGKGDSGDGFTLSLCVVRHFWMDKATGEELIRGTASNHICDLQPGDKVLLTGPTGKHFFLPADFMERDFVFVATGTGIAPYRGMLQVLFEAGYKGKAWLFFGVQHDDLVLYHDEFRDIKEKHPNFECTYAISRDEQNPVPEIVPTRQNRMYVQVKMHLEREGLKEVFSKPNSMLYLCGLKGMEEGIFSVMDALGADMGVEGSLIDQLKARHVLRMEVY